MLTAQNLTFSYPHGSRTPAIADLTATWKAGEFCALVGPNGSGKTTLLRTLSGELAPSAGSVCWDGRSLTEFDAALLARRRALLSQSPRLDFAFSVEEVVALGRSPYAEHPERAEDAARIAQALRSVGVENWARRAYPELSRGEKQRVHLARILAQLPTEEPERSALLLDEPTNHLDLSHQHQTLGLARACAREGRLVITVLHDLNLALQYADRVLVLAEGAAIADGHPVDVLSPDLLAEVFAVCATLVRLPGDRPFLAIAGGHPHG